MVLASCNNGEYAPGMPLKTSVSSRRWQYPGGVGEALTSKHYRIYTTTRHASLMQILPGFLEAAYVNYQQLTGLDEPLVSEPMTVYMLASRAQWVHLSDWVFGSGGQHHSISAGAYSFRGINVCWDLQSRSTLSIVAHEGMHQFLYHRLTNRLPLCIAEGLATSAEGYHIRGWAGGLGGDDARGATVVFPAGHNPQRFTGLSKVVNSGRWTPIDRLVEMNASDYLSKDNYYKLGWYGQVWALMQFLQSDPTYRRGLQRMLSDARDGRFHVALKAHPQFRNITPRAVELQQRTPRVYNRKFSRPLFEYYIQSDLKRFEREYRAFARGLVSLDSNVAR